MAARKVNHKYKPTVLDIFCGAGGMSLGFKNAGCKILSGIDQNPHAMKTHHHNFPETKVKLPAQDIRDIKELEQLGLRPNEVDIIVGGPPCQVFSRVGIGKMRDLGKDVELDHRNFLYKEFVRFVAYYKPLFFVMENVDNLARKSDVILNIKKDFSKNKHSGYPGYNVSYQVLNSSDFGVPQKRKRLFIIGARSDLDIESPFPTQSSKKAVSVGDAISDLPAIQPVITPLGIRVYTKREDTGLSYICDPQSDYQKTMRGKQKLVLNHICRSHNDKDILIFKILNQGGKYKDIPKEMMRYRADIFDDKYRRLIMDSPSWTLTAHMKKDGLAYIHPLQDRSISVREAARIQSFPDDFIFCAPMGRMFELVGNSVPPLLAKAVAEPLVSFIRKNTEMLESLEF
jgi:DNA (cytosine-5)-methyltransferase 1